MLNQAAKRSSLGKGIRSLIGILAVAVVIITLLRWFEHSQVFQPTFTLDPRVPDGAPAFDAIQLTAADGTRIGAWHFPPVPGKPLAEWTILFAHGNAGNRSHRFGTYAILHDLGVGILAFDYRGYGGSEGRPSEQGAYQDIHAAYRWLRDHQDIPPDRIVAMGESLGGGIASWLAAREPVGGLILQSTFTSIPDVGRELFPYLPVRWAGRIRFDTRDRLRDLHIPVLILHSRTDTLIRFHHAEANYAAANEPKQLVEIDGDHNDQPWANPQQFQQALHHFLSSLP